MGVDFEGVNYTAFYSNFQVEEEPLFVSESVALTKRCQQLKPLYHNMTEWHLPQVTVIMMSMRVKTVQSYFLALCGTEDAIPQTSMVSIITMDHYQNYGLS